MVFTMIKSSSIFKTKTLINSSKGKKKHHLSFLLTIQDRKLQEHKVDHQQIRSITL